MKQRGKRLARTLIGPIILFVLAASFLTYGQPTCPEDNGQTATIYVSGGYIVGGPDDGDPYTGTLCGTSGDDIIVGTNGADTIYGYGGDDIICGGNQDDTIYGGDGNDTIYGGNGEDEIYGGEGNDTIYGGNGKDDLSGDDGADTIYGGNGSDTIDGGNGNDSLDGGNGNDDIDGGAGDDICVNGPDYVNCEAGCLLEITVTNPGSLTIIQTDLDSWFGNSSDRYQPFSGSPITVTVMGGTGYTVTAYYTVLPTPNPTFSAAPIRIENPEGSGTWVYLSDDSLSPTTLNGISGNPGSNTYPIQVDLARLGDREASEAFTFTIHVLVSI